VNVTLIGKRVFVDVIKLRVLRWYHPGLSGWARNPMTSVSKRQKRRYREDHVTREAEPPESGRGRDPPSGGGMALRTP